MSRDANVLRDKVWMIVDFRVSSDIWPARRIDAGQMQTLSSVHGQSCRSISASFEEAKQVRESEIIIIIIISCHINFLSRRVVVSVLVLCKRRVFEQFQKNLF